MVLVITFECDAYGCSLSLPSRNSWQTMNIEFSSKADAAYLQLDNAVIFESQFEFASIFQY